MTQVSDQDLKAIREWLEKEPCLPKNFEDITLKKFVFSCHCSLERSKQCLEKFCRSRRAMPELYSARDAAAAGVRSAFSYTHVSIYEAGKDELIIHKLLDLTDFDFYDVLKAFTMQADHWLALPVDRLPEGHVFILDLQVYSLALVTRVNIFFFQKFIIFLLEAMPVRLTQIHLLNCPSYYEYLYNLVKPVIPLEIRKLIKFHPGVEGLHEYIDKKYLPSEYGGDAESMEEVHARWTHEIQDKRELFLNDELWKATDGGVKSKAVDTAFSMNGSFKSLAID